MRRVVAIMAIVAIVAVASMPVLLPQEEVPAFSAYNHSDRGLSDLRGEAALRGEVRSISTTPCLLDEEREPARALYVAAAVGRRYTAVELDAIVNFVEEGGRVLVADDTGFGQQLGDALAAASPDGTSLGFTGKIVYEGEGSSPLGTTVMRLGGIRYALELSSPTAVFAQGPGVEALATSSQDDCTDWDADGEAEIGEVGRVPLAASFKLGAGRGILIGDPDVLTNGVAASAPANFTSDLLSWLLPDGGTVYFDESRHPRESGAAMDAYLTGMAIAASEGAISYLLVAVAVVAGAIILLSRNDPAPWRHTFDLSGYRRPPKRLVEDTGAILANELASRVESATGKGREELANASDRELETLLGGPLLVDVIKGRSLSPSETEKAVEQIRKWKHG